MATFLEGKVVGFDANGKFAPKKFTVRVAGGGTEVRELTWRERFVLEELDLIVAGWYDDALPSQHTHTAKATTSVSIESGN